LFHYYVFVCILPGKAVPEMTYAVSGGTLNPTHSLTHVGNGHVGRNQFYHIGCQQMPSLILRWLGQGKMWCWWNCKNCKLQAVWQLLMSGCASYAICCLFVLSDRLSVHAVHRLLALCVA